jgi:hypothetical protein
LKVQLTFEEAEYDRIFPLLIEVVQGHPVELRIFRPEPPILDSEDISVGEWVTPYLKLVKD